LWPLLSTPLVILMCPELSGSGKFGTPCLRMQAEYAIAVPVPEPLDWAELLVLALVEGACATCVPDESPQADASRPSPAAAASVTATRLARASLDRRRPSSGATAVALPDSMSITPLLIQESSRRRSSARLVTAGERQLLPGCNRR
jgi:hypothetical protein